MTGAADPMMKFPQGTIFSPFSTLRNISTDPVADTPEMFWMQSGTAHRQALLALTMAPGTSVLLDTHALLIQAGLAGFNGTINFTFTTPASPSALLLSSGSVDQTASYVFQVLPHVVTESVSRTLSYWSTANGNDTMVTI